MVDHDTKTKWTLKDDQAASVVAIVFPIVLIALFGSVSFSFCPTVPRGIRQLVTEYARTAVAGLGATERGALAQSIISKDIGFHPLIAATRRKRDAAAAEPMPARIVAGLRCGGAVLVN